LKTIFALGNPRSRYRDTRHNVGWWLADRLRACWSLPAFRADRCTARTAGEVSGRPVQVVKPLTYVNRSGRALMPLLEMPDFRPDRDLLVAVDDVALPPGAFRLRARGSAGGHKGLSSVEEVVGGREYGRVRIGVGRPHDARIDLAEWVLAPLMPADEEAVLSSFKRIIEAVECWLEEDMETAMNRYNKS